MAKNFSELLVTATGGAASRKLGEWLGILGGGHPAPEEKYPFAMFTESPSGTSRKTSLGIFGEDDGDHEDELHTLYAIQYRPAGSGTNGPGHSDNALVVSNIKKDILTTGVVGEMNGVYSVIRNAGAGSDGAAFLADVATYGSGFLGVLEGTTNVFTDGGANPYSVNVQIGCLDNVGNVFNGYFVRAKEGALSSAFWATTNSGATWEYLFRGQKSNTDVFTVDGNGLVRSTSGYRGYIDNTNTTSPLLQLEQDGTGDVSMQWLLTGARAWVAGIDNSDGDAWKLSPQNDGFTANVALKVTTGGAVLALNPTGGLGYGAGAGGAVTQDASKSTDVTLDKICGRITMHNAAMAAGDKLIFAVTNSTVEATDFVAAIHTSAGTTLGYNVQVVRVETGKFHVMVENVTAGPLSEAIVVSFMVFKSVSA